MKDIITKAKLEQMPDLTKEVTFPLGTVLTQAAKEWIRQKEIQVRYAGDQPADAEAAEGHEQQQRVIITVIGLDKVGIIAAVSAVLANCGANILDISQTVLQDFFAMNMVADLAGCRVDFATLRQTLEDEGEKLDLKITVQHEDIFRFMHRV